MPVEPTVPEIVDEVTVNLLPLTRSVYVALITDAADSLGFLFHFLIETALHLVGRFRIDDYAEGFAARHLVGVGIAYRRIIIEVERYFSSDIRTTTEEHFGAGVCHCFMGLMVENQLQK